MKAKSDRRQFLTAGAAAAGTVAAGSLGFVRAAAAQGDESITQLAHFSIDAAREKEAVAAIETLVKGVEDNEPDVTAYMVYRDAESPEALTFFEVYKNAAALQNHGQQPHLAALRTAFQSGLFKGPVKIVKLDAVAGVHR